MARKVILLMLLLLALAAPLTVLAQSGGIYDLSWHVIGSGGATFSSAGSYSLGGTIGQPDTAVLAGGAYGLRGGFWDQLSGYTLYLPLLLKS